jgi:hypothetical protein
MEEIFILPVKHQGKTMEFEARLVVLGYTHKFLVDVNGTEVVFEPDESREYRAILKDPEGQFGSRQMDSSLLEAIRDVILSISADE